ncbi:hypothetical protein EVAR_30993_1 [Eumeta japonica]|uniref:Uncharacterized protein n=1 Tax=Eumeta variegata TaxID=151549 RepID=A0A4C1W7B1_EUMVA|nr:hypothetical protein EVAR_30993_1 [Eumeta japonica]
MRSRESVPGAAGVGRDFNIQICFHCSGETCSNVMELSELINENDFDDEPPTLTPLPPVLPLVFNSETRSDAEPQPGPSKRLRTE